MNNSLTNKIVKSALIAGLYAVLTLILQPISYGPVQFRLSEMLILIVFINSNYIVGLTVGCLISNFFGGFGPLDIIFGTLATFLSLICISITAKKMDGLKGLIIASLWPTIFNGLIIGIMLNYVTNAPLFLTIVQVAIGEFVVLTIIGIPIFRKVLPRLKKVL